MKTERVTDREYIIHYSDQQSLTSDTAKGAHNVGIRQGVVTAVYGRDFFGPSVSSARTFVDKVGNGWPELVHAVRVRSEALSVDPEELPTALTQTTRRRRVRSDAGSELDIHMVYQGQLDRAWTNTRREASRGRRKAAHLYISIGGSVLACAIDSQWRAAVAYKVSDMLQRCGYSVEITVGSSATQAHAGKTTHVSYTAKQPGDPMDLSRVAIQTTLGWHRYASFVGRCCNDLGLATAKHMGSTVECVPPHMLERELAGELLINIPHGIFSHATARAALASATAAFERHVGAPL